MGADGLGSVPPVPGPTTLSTGLDSSCEKKFPPILSNPEDEPDELDSSVCCSNKVPTDKANPLTGSMSEIIMAILKIIFFMFILLLKQWHEENKAGLRAFVLYFKSNSFNLNIFYLLTASFFIWLIPEDFIETMYTPAELTGMLNSGSSVE